MEVILALMSVLGFVFFGFGIVLATAMFARRETEGPIFFFGCILLGLGAGFLGSILMIILDKLDRILNAI